MVARGSEPAGLNKGCAILCKNLSESWFPQVENGNTKPTCQGYRKKKKKFKDHR